MATIRKNGKAYDSIDVKITMFGIQEDEVKEISYSTKQEHQVNHSLSGTGTSWSMGKESNEATITLYMNATRKIEDAAKAAGAKNIIGIAPFDIQVSFLNEFNVEVNDTVTVKFQGTGRNVTGDMGLAYQHELFCLGVDYNNA